MVYSYSHKGLHYFFPHYLQSVSISLELSLKSPEESGFTSYKLCLFIGKRVRRITVRKDNR